jgi:hypothetical protein
LARPKGELAAATRRSARAFAVRDVPLGLPGGIMLKCACRHEHRGPEALCVIMPGGIMCYNARRHYVL